MNRYIVLLCGLNIRSYNRITLDKQHAAFEAVAGEIAVTRIEGDKGTFLLTSDHEAPYVIEVIRRTLSTHRPDLKTLRAAVTSPEAVASGLAELTNVLTSKYGRDFFATDHEIRSGGDRWRAGLAFPLFPGEISVQRSIFHMTKNAIILGWTTGCVLVAKLEAENVHWGNIVTKPALAQMKRLDGLDVKLTSRSGNVLRKLIA